MFGKEDVDLRIAPLITAEANIQEVAEASLLEQVSRDIDLRLRPELIEDNSQESSEKVKICDQVENSDVDQDQNKVKGKCDTEVRIASYKRNVSGKPSKTTENEDTSETFSSGSEDEMLKQSHRVPHKRRCQENDRSHAIAAPAKSINDTSAPKERRPRKTKWNSPWEETVKPPVIPMQTLPSNIIPTLPFAPIRQTPQPISIANESENMRNMRQFSSRNAPESVWQPNAMPFNGPSPLGLLNNVSVQTNLLGNNQIVMAQHGPSLAPCTVKDRTINIDGVPREIRFYDETAIAFMEPNGKEPKEIGFQSGERRVCVDNNESIVLAFNDTYKPFVINGKPCQIRFGTPTRELYIDNEWYECYFGDPAVGIVLNNKLHSFRIDGPAPQVRIGNLRSDLVVGKVDMYVDTQTKASLFLDAQVQMVQINNQMHSVQFADYLLTVIIDNIPFPVQYGAMPVKYQLANSEHYIRFSVLPNHIMAGKVYIRNMKRTHLQRDLVSPVPTAAMPSIPPVTGPILPLMSIVAKPDIITSNSTNSKPSRSKQSDIPIASESSNPPSMDINDLYQKLLATGILNKPNQEASSSRVKLTPVILSKPETLKKRQTAIIDALFSGTQCSSCGVRFPKQQTTKYSQHLDWHFRQNKRDRDSARRAQNRKWYYSVDDWIQYEEIENLEEREKNWFETQQNEMDSGNEESNQRSASPIQSCIAGPDDHNKTCDMCHDPFETFYNEETEEWHLRNAIRVEENIYHPICYEDYKVSATLATLSFT